MSARTDALRALLAESMRPEDVTVQEVYRLWSIISRNLVDHDPEMRMRLHPLNDMVMEALHRHGWPLRGVEIQVRGSYFDRREAVTFGTSGFIGFCGWADSLNSKPIEDGFEEWVRTFERRIPVAEKEG